MSLASSPAAARAAPIHPAPAVAWWRLPIVWLVIALPLASVVAGLGMLRLAWTDADRLLAAPAQVSATGGAAPALKARNHAATGVR